MKRLRRQSGVAAIGAVVLLLVVLALALWGYFSSLSEPECAAVGEACETASDCCSTLACSATGVCCREVGDRADSAAQCCTGALRVERCCATAGTEAEAAEDCCLGLFYIPSATGGGGAPATCEPECPPRCTLVAGTHVGEPDRCECGPAPEVCRCEPCQAGGCDCPAAGGRNYIVVAHNCGLSHPQCDRTPVFWAPDDDTARRCACAGIPCSDDGVPRQLDFAGSMAEADAFCIECTLP